MVDHLHAADVDAARRSAANHAELAGSDPTGIVGFHQANLDTVVALVDRAAAVGAHLGSTTVDQVVFAQRFWIAHVDADHATMGLFADLLAPSADERHPIWDAARAVALADVARVAEATDTLAAIVARTDRLDGIPHGPHRLPTLALMAIALDGLGCAGLDLGAPGAAVRAALAAEPIEGVLIGWPTVYLGTRSHMLDLVS